MPGWHDATRELQRAGKLKTVGILQEQHPERARLFMQWKRMDWPLMVDALNLLELQVVPRTLLIDEHGIVREIGGRTSGAAEQLAAFVARRYPAPETPAPKPRPRGRAEQLYLWGGAERSAEAVRAFARAVDRNPADGRAHFRLGVALRRDYDLRGGSRTFQGAVEAWGAALTRDPNNYIWRRRIQQYGPRADKPYPFYDWVPVAREEILARGETPLPLRVEPGGSEFASPVRRFAASGTTDGKEPDPTGRLHRDDGTFIAVETAVVPSPLAPGGTARVHLVFRPAREEAHWNNEGGGLTLWLPDHERVAFDRRSVFVPGPADRVVSDEARRVEFELQVGETGDWTRLLVPLYATYYVCESERGTCLYRRRDFTVIVKLAP